MTQVQYITTKDLVAGCKTRDRRSQRLLYDRYVLKLYNTAMRIVRSKEDAEDALQRSFRNAFEKIDTFHETKGQLGAWLNRICINESLATLRRRKLNFESIDQHMNVESGAHSIIDDLDTEYIYAALDRLNDEQKVIFNLYEIEGYSHNEIAKLLEINPSTSRTYLARAKKNLRRSIESYRQEQKKYRG